MPLLILGILIGVIVCSLYMTNRSSSSLNLFDAGDTYIVIDHGTVRVRRGFIPERAMAALADTLRNAGVTNGNITMSRDNRVAISWHIPPALHQTIRNILLLERSAASQAGGCSA